jgi:hypothetical protein
MQDTSNYAGLELTSASDGLKLTLPREDGILWLRPFHKELNP